MSLSSLQAAEDEGYAEALEDVETRIAEIHKTLLWDMSDLKDPRTQRFWNDRARYKYACMTNRAIGLRTAARICERLRIDGFED